VKKLKQYVLVLLIASFLAISSLGIGVTVITNASDIMEDSDITETTTCTYDITVFKYYDVAGTGSYVENEDWPIEGWHFELYYWQDQGIGDPRDHPPWYYIAEGWTDSDGYLVFEDLQCATFPSDKNGHYKVREYIPVGWEHTTTWLRDTPITSESNHMLQNEMEVLETDNGEEYDTEVEISLFLTSDKSIDFGNRMKDGEITVYKLYEMDESGLGGWTFHLWTSVDGVKDEYLGNGTTDENGEFTFEGLYPGYYIVEEELQDDWYNVSALEQEVTVEADETSYVWFFNAMEDGSITVYKYYEREETGLEGWTFNLWSTEDEEKHENIASGTTDVNGQYTFENVYPGEYIVEEMLKDGWYNTTALEQEVTVYPNENSIVEFWNDMLDGSITVYKFYDYEMTGEYNPEIDDLLEDWTFHLWTAVDGETDVHLGSGTTDVNGEYTFEDLYPGDYIVEEVLPEGWENTTALEQLITVEPDQESIVWFGNVEEEIFGEITVYKFYDANYDGVFDTEEELIDGFMFQLWAADEEGNPTEEIGEAVNTMEGMYTFEELEPGNYVVQEIIPEVGEDECCWLSTTGLLQHVEVQPEGIYSLYFGNVRGGRIEGMKFLDIEADGNFDVGVDKPLMGWEIHLYEAYRSMTADIWIMGDHVASTETNRSGQYYFDCVMPGHYFVQEEMYEGWYNVTSDTQLVYVEPCETTEGVDFANCMYKDIYGIKFYDYNMDGEFNDEDWVLPGWNIYLYRVENEEEILVDETSTDHLGYYYFEGLTVGTYYVREEIREGWDSTTDSEVEVVLNCCTPCRVVNFGNYEFPEITINKFYDVEMTGEYNPEDGDYLIDEMVQFDVYGEFEGVQVYAELMDVTGTYNFFVPVGDFNVTEYLPAGWVNTTPLMQEMSLGPGDHWIVYFGNVEYGDLEVYKFYDENMDGEWQCGEEMLEGWMFNLWNTTDEGLPGAIIATNVTDEDGLAMFESLESGLYAVEEVVQDCWFPTTDVIQYVEITAGETFELWFGNVPGGFIEGYKFCDVNMNEVFDDDECGLEGWEIRLYRIHDMEETPLLVPDYMYTFTDEDGYYNFTCIEPGMYRIEEVIQCGWYNSTAWYYEIEVLPEGYQRIDFGNYRHGDIYGMKYCDFNMNGEFDECLDWPIYGWEIQLWEADVEGNPTSQIDTAYTDNWGMYRFEDLAPGDYVVKEVLGPCGWINTTDMEVHVRIGCVEEVEVNFGNYRQSDISVKAYDYEMNEPVAGLALYLWEADEYGNPIGEGPIAEGVTGDHGYYIFGKYDPGYYVIETEDEQLLPVTLRCCTEYVIIEYYDYNYDTPENDTALATYAKIE